MVEENHMSQLIKNFQTFRETGRKKQNNLITSRKNFLANV